MEAAFRWALVTAIAPVAWGTNYFVTHQFLPAGYPLYGAAIRALPAGLLLLLVSGKRPRGSWWWKSLALGTLNMSAFFALIYLAAQLLPTSVASAVMATSPVVMMLLAWSLLSERPRIPHLAGAGIGVAGVCLMLFTGVAAVGVLGVLASIAAMVMSSLGYVLAKRWSAGVDVLSSTSWQLIAGGVVLVPFAVVAEGAPPALEGPAILGFAYVTVVATALAFAAWFAGLRHLPAGTVGLVGLLNPVTGVLLGTTVAGEALTARQLCGLVLVLLGILLGQPGAARLAALVRGRVCRPSPPAGAAPATAASPAGPSPPRSPATTTSIRPRGVSDHEMATGTANTPGQEVTRGGSRAGCVTPTDRSRDAGSR
ncbi:DMT family transporter [Streptosporangium minutum]|uniref:EamA family transporter n=1 Tax=Streptosporangium minutum TaxID=569862 RepID=A0A243RAF9_9ACTN|nr:EamA family transporter [Streptosporangium minutum]OUC91624.1 EamA family transporter [Streptosporangium minutum]